ncbi:hypothetical protein [Kordiimonas aquimaris]|uniref:hypothetical protein n=1 Tax=Kordiimonas aquimaris TaxID=707591 RepID=UPI0021CF4219|nr:hypothetical protein [Kordiimonas aquimaris]
MTIPDVAKIPPEPENKSTSQPEESGEAVNGSENEAFTPDFDDSEPLEGEVLKPGEKSEEELRQEAEEKAEHDAYTLETDPLKDAFYGVMCAVSNQAAKIAGQRIPMGEPIAAMQLKNRGAVGRMASDQVFDKLWKTAEFMRATLRKLKHANKLKQEWGAIWLLMVEMAEETIKEVNARQAAYAEQQEAQQQEAA